MGEGDAVTYGRRVARVGVVLSVVIAVQAVLTEIAEFSKEKLN